MSGGQLEISESRPETDGGTQSTHHSKEHEVTLGEVVRGLELLLLECAQERFGERE